MRGTVGRTAMVVAVVAAALALSATTAFAGTPPHLVKDINPGSADSDPFNIVNDGGKALFAAFDPTHGLELHISDGTQAGTHLVLDANPGPDQGAADFFPAKIGTKFVYEGNDGTHGYEPWITDGTSSGTHHDQGHRPWEPRLDSLWLHRVERQGLFRSHGRHRRH